mgnify:CR=1 FL=1
MAATVSAIDLERRDALAAAFSGSLIDANHERYEEVRKVRQRLDRQAAAADRTLSRHSGRRRSDCVRARKSGLEISVRGGGPAWRVRPSLTAA